MFGIVTASKEYQSYNILFLSVEFVAERFLAQVKDHLDVTVLLHFEKTNNKAQHI